MKRLIFVYNADSGLLAGALDVAHKLLSPATYACRLCALTHGHFGMRKRWREFIEKSAIRLEFLHRDEWLRRHDREVAASLPAVYSIDESGSGAPQIAITAAEITGCRDLDELIQKLETLARAT